MKSKSKIIGVITLQLVILMGILTNCSVLANNTPWYRTWGGTEDDFGNAIAIALDGSIYCAGYTFSTVGTGADYALIKYYSNGTKAWEKAWGGISTEVLYGVTVDTSGNVYCVGKNGTNPVFLVLFKFFPNSTQCWNLSRKISGFSDIWLDVLVDENGSIYCAGLTTEFGAESDGDLSVFKYYANKTLAWEAHQDSGTSGADCAYAIAIDSKGSIYCAGDTMHMGIMFYLVKFYANGSLALSKYWGTVTGNHLYGIAVGLDGCIYCAGEKTESSIRDLVLFKYTPNLMQLSTQIWGESDVHESALGLTTDTSRNIICAGYKGTDIVLLKFDVNITLLWSKTWGGGNNDLAEDVAIDSQGCIICVGKTESWGAGKNDALIVKFSASGDGPSTDGGIPGFGVLFTVVSVSAVLLALRKRQI